MTIDLRKPDGGVYVRCDGERVETSSPALVQKTIRQPLKASSGRVHPRGRKRPIFLCLSSGVLALAVAAMVAHAPTQPTPPAAHEPTPKTTEEPQPPEPPTTPAPDEPAPETPAEAPHDDDDTPTEPIDIPDPDIAVEVIPEWSGNPINRMAGIPYTVYPRIDVWVRIDGRLTEIDLFFPDLA